MCRKGISYFVIVCILVIGHLGLMGTALGATYNVGDYWEYDYEEELEDVELDGTIRMEVTGFDTVTVGGVSYDTTVVSINGDGAYSGTSSGVMMSGAWGITGKLYLQKSNDELIKSVLDYSLDGTATYSGITYDQTTTMHNITSYYLLVDQRSPSVHMGDMGYSRATVTSHTTIHMDMNGYTDDSSEDHSFEEEKHYNCIKKETVTIPAGKFETFLVRTSKSDGSYTLDWFSNKVGNSVKAEAYNQDGVRNTKYELTSYEYKAGESEETILGLSPFNFYIFLLLILIIIFVIVVIIAVKRKGKQRSEPTRILPSQETQQSFNYQQPQYPQQPQFPQQPRQPQYPPPPQSR